MNNQQQPAREQIAEAITSNVGPTYYSDRGMGVAGIEAATDAVLALLSQPTPSAEPDDLEWCHLCGAVLDGTADDRRVHRHAFEGLRPPGDDEHPFAEPPSNADMAPGTMFTARQFGGHWLRLVRVVGGVATTDEPHVLVADIDPSTIRDVTPPKGVQ